MRTLGRALTALLIGALLLAGCGLDSSTDGVEQTPTSQSPSPSEPSMSIGDPVQEPTVVGMVSETDAGGWVSATPVPVGDAAALRDFADQFGGRMSREISQAAAGATVPDGQTLLASVVDISCVPPLDVSVKVGDGGVRVQPLKEKPIGRAPQCLAPVTTVAIVTAIV
ncbi:MAG: hypothetical protein WKF50_10925 [Nocardioides sp.]